MRFIWKLMLCLFPCKIFVEVKYFTCKIWGQFLLRPSVALVVIFSLESPTLEGKPSSLCHIRDDQW